MVEHRAALQQLHRAGVLRTWKTPAPICGVYFLIEKNEIVYVGKSVDVAARIATHVREGTKQFTTVHFVVVPKTLLSGVEAMFIRGLCPRFNRGPWLAQGANPDYLRQALRIVAEAAADTVPIEAQAQAEAHAQQDLADVPPPERPALTLPELVARGLEDIAATAHSPLTRFLAEVDLGRRTMADLPDSFKFWLPGPAPWDPAWAQGQQPPPPKHQGIQPPSPAISMLTTSPARVE